MNSESGKTLRRLRSRARSVLAGFCFAVFGGGSFVFGLSLLPLLFLLPEIPRRRVAVAANRLLWKFFVALMVGLRLISVRMENSSALASARGVIVAANHPSLIDVVILLSRTPRPVCVVKGALSRNVFMKRVVRIAHIGNDMPPEEFFSKAQALLARGFNILIFPEGTRTVPGARPAFRRSAAWLSLRTGASVVPVRICVEPPILGKCQPWHDVADRCAEYRLTVGAPLEPAAFGGNGEPPRRRAIRMTGALRSILLDEN